MESHKAGLVVRVWRNNHQRKGATDYGKSDAAIVGQIRLTEVPVDTDKEVEVGQRKSQQEGVVEISVCGIENPIPVYIDVHQLAVKYDVALDIDKIPDRQFGGSHSQRNVWQVAVKDIRVTQAHDTGACQVKATRAAHTHARREVEVDAARRCKGNKAREIRCGQLGHTHRVSGTQGNI